ncbi:MAG: hypothetical protein ACR2RL_25230 [Gammaproteobacteria bacterium]
MTAIRIQRCRVRVQRHGGWSWGANRERLVDGVTRALPVLIEALLRDIRVKDDAEAVIPRLAARVPVTLAQLVEFSSASAADYFVRRAGFEESIDSKTRRDFVLALDRAVRAQSGPSNQIASTQPAAVADLCGPVVAHRPVLLDIIRRWYAAGHLLHILATSAPAAIAQWLHELLRQASPSGGARELDGSVVADATNEVEAQLSRCPSLWRRRAATALLVSCKHDALPREMLESLLEEQPDVRLTIGNKDSAQPIALDSSEPSPASARTRQSANASAQLRGRHDISSIVPYVITGVLARTGYLDALAGAFEVADIQDEAGSFAAGIVYKTAPPPLRGWHRDHATQRLAALFGGRAATPANEQLIRFFSAYGPGASMLDAVLRADGLSPKRPPALGMESAQATLAQPARSPFPPLFALHYNRRWVLSAWRDYRVVSWHDTGRSLTDAVSGLEPAACVLNAADAHDSVARSTLDRLQAAGIRVLTPLAPCFSRDDAGRAWRRLGNGWWTNSADVTAHEVGKYARGLDAAQQIVSQLDEALLDERPLFIPRPSPAKPETAAAEYSLTAAVATALEAIGVALWQERGTALKALARFTDLDGSVTFEASRIVVRPALGSRYMDLAKARLLVDVANVPWWPGRRLEFAGL